MRRVESQNSNQISYSSINLNNNVKEKENLENIKNLMLQKTPNLKNNLDLDSLLVKGFSTPYSKTKYDKSKNSLKTTSNSKNSNKIKQPITLKKKFEDTRLIEINLSDDINYETTTENANGTFYSTNNCNNENNIMISNNDEV